MRGLLAALAMMMGIGGAAEAATMQAVFTGTVGTSSMRSGYDELGIFVSPGASLVGQNFTLSFVYEKSGSFHFGEGTSFEYLSGGMSKEGFSPPYRTIKLIVAGREYITESDFGLLSSWVHSNGGSFGGYTNTWDGMSDGYFSAGFWSPLLDPDFETPFSSTLPAGSSPSEGDFFISRCSGMICQQTSGALLISSLAVSAIPLPASAWLLGVALAGLGGLGWRRSRESADSLAV